MGVSPDSVKSHAKFKQKFQLTFPLLADEGHKVCELYVCVGSQEIYGQGIRRRTSHHFPDRRGWEYQRSVQNVRPAEHSADLLAKLGLT